MRHLFYILSILFIVTACSSDDSSFDNPNLIEPGFSYNINLNLPQYANLATPGTAVYVNNSNVGIRGIFVINLFGSYRAWEASCPNHPPNNCSTMTLSGVTCKCSCEDYEYELAGGSLVSEFSGEGKAYPLQEYSVSAEGSNVRIYN
ncbi:MULTISPECIES: Rieske (2Fe-2S) protein [Galbibacter]|uniref:Rieske domain-containing protein n=1 Tax=Galbibacter orientalis DSM 19592 TaxID=926559 RepID=I3C4S2_9FLAO|nr:hypothetical protein [Galbibacter orientalis]EIJ38615.1 hypothetical protein JoomaDRAFT_1603 [Galbibacter orientalis DSM 19592]